MKIIWKLNQTENTLICRNKRCNQISNNLNVSASTISLTNYAVSIVCGEGYPSEKTISYVHIGSF
jgi:hypothetical protein